MSSDHSNGYDTIAAEFIDIRSTVGTDIVTKWADTLPPKSTVVDIGAGSGMPLTSILIKKGLSVFAIDASPRMVTAFRQQFPTIEIACEPAEQSRFFGRHFDAALAIGLIFLLPEDRQTVLLRHICSVLNPGGRLLFSAPHQTCTWKDMLTGQISSSLGRDAYSAILSDADMILLGTHEDEGGNNYYDAQKKL
ncbi:bifunctional 2-polyprenyl-6-hydroxyphenol methylase/3-demethylubiquinol 3-O-methyltransferase UbiG [Parvularcula sp. IMCC14364]|uniref:class I SAM-dependent methyltransferase n=1 Tax=Parvularcula sp. IMCC14364 TaxID=3067902 RepID=UPI002740F7F3|nr:class I SAM-dependent methyltransferase [Parvularcula sp. IMCC14364]